MAFAVSNITLAATRITSLLRNAASPSNASKLAAPVHQSGATRIIPRTFSTSTRLLNTVPGGHGAGSAGSATAASASTHRGVMGFFPRRVTWAGAFAIFALGFVDGGVSAEWYLSRSASKEQA